MSIHYCQTGRATRNSGAGADTLVYVHAGHRIGSGILIGGTVYRGSGGASGEIGALGPIGWSKAPDSLNALVRQEGMPEVRTSTFGTDGVVVGAIRGALAWADQNVFTANPSLAYGAT